VSTKYTPWGYAQSLKTIAPGIVRADTASHGGYGLTDERLAEMPADLRKPYRYDGVNWFEEDCDWALVCLAFPEFFKPQDYYFAVETCRSYHAEVVTPEREAKAAAWLAVNGDKWAAGCEGTADGGWFVNAYKIADPSQRTRKVFAGVVVLPSVFTLEQFENAPLFNAEAHGFQFMGGGAA
jgi:hypothetical protein